jgi:hypothetical protein
MKEGTLQIADPRMFTRSTYGFWGAKSSSWPQNPSVYRFWQVRPLNSTVGPQNIRLAALKEEENGGGARLEDQILSVIQSLHSGDSESMILILKWLAPHSEEARKMQQTGHKGYQRLKEDRRLIDRIMSESTLGYPTGGTTGSLVEGWIIPNSPMQIQDRVLIYQIDHWREFVIQWSKARSVMRTASEAQLLSCLRNLLD